MIISCAVKDLIGSLSVFPMIERKGPTNVQIY